VDRALTTSKSPRSLSMRSRRSANATSVPAFVRTTAGIRYQRRCPGSARNGVEEQRDPIVAVAGVAGAAATRPDAATATAMSAKVRRAGRAEVTDPLSAARPPT
jgi:hypothetical protein